MSTDGWQQYAVTVGELRKRLEGIPDDMPVIMAKDPEGNGYSPLSAVDSGFVYEPESTWAGEVHDPADPDYEPDGSGVTVVVLGPVN